jgi:hypothetical protein
VTIMLYLCAEISERQRNELCFKTSYRNCESKHVNGTSSEARLSLKLFQNVEMKEGLF